MNPEQPDAIIEIARAAIKSLPGSAEPISCNEAAAVIREHAADYLPPATAGLLTQLATMEIAGTLPRRLVVPLCDVGRELLSTARAERTTTP